MIISQGHKSFTKLINLLQVIAPDDTIQLVDENPDVGGPTVLGLVSTKEYWREVQIWYTAENCHIVWMDKDGNCCEQQLDDLPLVVGRVVSYLEGMTSELTFPVKE